MPTGPWALVALGLSSVTAWSIGCATTVPADERFFVIAALTGSFAAVALHRSICDRRAGFVRCWPATTAATVAISAALPASVMAFAPMAFGLGIVSVVVGVVTLGLMVAELPRRVSDVVVAVFLVGLGIAVAQVDLVALRLTDRTTTELAREAAALTERGEPEGPPITGDRRSPFLVVESDRSMVAWPLPGWDTSLPVLVHDPTGRLEGSGRFGGLDECRHVTGPWWTCSAG